MLRSKGKCVDIRPVICRPALEVFVAGKPERAGEIDDAPDEPNVLAADVAVREVLAAGLFEEAASSTFEYSYIWRTLEQTLDYFEEHWSDYAILPADVVQSARQLVKCEAFDSKLRVKWRMMIAVYGKR